MKKKDKYTYTIIIFTDIDHKPVNILVIDI